MPSTVLSRRSHISTNSDDDDDSQDGLSGSSTPKRARLEASDRYRGVQTQGVDDSWALTPPPPGNQENGISEHQILPDSYLRSPPRTRHELNSGRSRHAQASITEHKPGAIVRIDLENFVTYTSVSFQPGPSLNMVIGPNGTGKSTLVCAICLGLGWGTQHLGRAKDIGEFVKHNKHEALIEIELKGHEGLANPVIKRIIKREGNKSHWFINGHSSNVKSVLALAKRFSIQIDNLCQFLPQDRVAEFARLTPVELLASTQRAAAPEYLIEWHEELKKLRDEQKKAQADESSVRDNLRNLEGRQNMQRADVERMRERAEVLKEVGMLENLRPFAQFKLAEAKAKDAKWRKDDLEAELVTLRAELEPTLRTLNNKADYKKQIEKTLARTKLNAEKAERLAEQHSRDKIAAEEQIKDCDSRRQAERKGDKERKADKARLEQDVRRLRLQMENAPAELDAAAYNDKIRDKQRQIRTIETDIREKTEIVREKSTEHREKTQKVVEAQKHLEKLKSQAGQQEEKLRSTSRDTKQAWDWVQRNRGKLVGQIYGPPLVECTVKDSRYVDMIETLLQRNDFLSFTCTDRRDFKMLQEQLYKTMRLSDITIRMVNVGLDQYNPPIGAEECQSLGLDGWAIDYIAGPGPVLAMLCGECRLHLTGVALREGSESQYAALESSRVDSWVTSQSSYQITRRREYGEGAVSTRVKPVQKARSWTNHQVDTRVESNLHDNINGWSSEAEALLQDGKRLQDEIKEMRSRIETLQEEKNELSSEKDTKQRALNDYRSLPTKLQGLEDKLARAVSTESRLRETLHAIFTEETELHLKKAQHVIDHAIAVDFFRKQHTELVTEALWLIEANSDIETLRNLNSDIDAQLTTKQRELREVKEDYQQLRNEHKATLDKCTSALAADPQLEEYYNALTQEQQDRVPAELELEIDSQRARLDLLHEGNPGAIAEFEARKKKIDSLVARLAELQANLSTVSASIATIRAKWEPELDALISKISAAFSVSFEKISCAGEVRLFKAPVTSTSTASIPPEPHSAGTSATPPPPDSDFDAWAVQICVRFRESEDLQILDAHRQSGGERAVSTIFYLMALQSLSRAPFRVVDEINQGMDPRNERIVHERMVEIACGAAAATPPSHDLDAPLQQQPVPTTSAASQYFLITPKLLPGLQYTQGMKVHCIASGGKMPDDWRRLDFAAMVPLARRLRESRDPGALMQDGVEAAG